MSERGTRFGIHIILYTYIYLPSRELFVQMETEIIPVCSSMSRLMTNNNGNRLPVPVGSPLCVIPFIFWRIVIFFFHLTGILPVVYVVLGHNLIIWTLTRSFWAIERKIRYDLLEILGLVLYSCPKGGCLQ